MREIRNNWCSLKVDTQRLAHKYKASVALTCIQVAFFGFAETERRKFIMQHKMILSVIKEKEMV